MLITFQELQTLVKGCGLVFKELFLLSRSFAVYCPGGLVSLRVNTHPHIVSALTHLVQPEACLPSPSPDRNCISC